ncbi:MAG: sugar phosphate nucleotidyltransferase [Syntrophobacteraceae bacterium]|jgi:choline kinase
MKIIILAAGKGERLLPLTQNTPKPLLDMGNGRTLLEEQLLSISNSGVIDEVVLVIGYLADQIEAKMKTYSDRGACIRTIFNPFFDVSNNLMSLWLAKHVIEEDDVLITNGDNIFTSDVFKGIAEENGEGIFLGISRKEGFDFDDMRVSLVDGLIARVHKNIPGELSHAESPGLALVRGKRVRKLFNQHLESLARMPQNIKSFWLETFNCLYEHCVPVKPWWFDAQDKWQEVDFHPDLAKARNQVSAKLNILAPVTPARASAPS